MVNARIKKIRDETALEQITIHFHVTMDILQRWRSLHFSNSGSRL